MSKISEQRSLEAYPIKHIVLPFCFSIPDLNEPYRKPYREGYNQAMQDFLEKAEEFLKNRTMAELCLDSESRELVDDFVDGFKKYIQDE